MSKDRPIRVELSREEIFEAAFFIGYSVAILPNNGQIDGLHARALKILQALIAAETEEEDPTITIESVGDK